MVYRFTVTTGWRRPDNIYSLQGTFDRRASIINSTNEYLLGQLALVSQVQINSAASTIACNGVIGGDR